MMKNPNEPWPFVLITFLITFSIGAGCYFWGFPQAKYLGIITMYVPALVVIFLFWVVYKRPVFKGNGLGFNFKNMRYWILCPLYIGAITSLGVIVPILWDPSALQSLEEIKTQAITTIPTGNWGLSLVMIFLINMFLAPIINMFMFLGEEVGWRGYLTPKLMKIFPKKHAFIISGLIWGTWHFWGLLVGLNYPGNPVLGLFMMVLLLTPIGIVFQYLYEKLGSIFVAGLCHGALNWTATTWSMFILSSDKLNPFLHGTTGIGSVLVWWVFALFLIRKINNPSRLEEA